MKPIDLKTAALVVVDVQKAFDILEAKGIPRNNPDAIVRIADLLAAFRRAGSAIVHIRHRGTSPNTLFKGTACEPRDEARERNGEPVVWKSVNSAFIGTDLEACLRRRGIHTLVLCGATSNHCVETTTRMAGNLGFDARFVQDATWTFERVGPDGRVYAADDIQAMTEANLSDEFAGIVTSSEVCRVPRTKAAICASPVWP